MKKCAKCKRMKSLSTFSERCISKKTGKQLYYSWCRKCNNNRQVERYHEEKEADKVRKKNRVDPQYLVRGKIHYEGLR